MLQHYNGIGGPAERAGAGHPAESEAEMSAMDGWRNEATAELLEAILRLESADEASAFFRDLCTLGELHDMAQRWAVVRLLDEGLHYADISGRTGASTATITRIAQWLHHGEGGYQKALERLRAAEGPAAGASRATAPAPAPASRPGRAPSR